MLRKIWNWMRRLFGIGVREEVFNPYTGEYQEVSPVAVTLKSTVRVLSWPLTLAATVCFITGNVVVGTIIQAVVFISIVVSVAIYYYDIGMAALAASFEFIKLCADKFRVQLLNVFRDPRLCLGSDG